MSVVVSATNYAEYALSAGSGQLPGVEYAAWVAMWAHIPTLFLIATMLFLLFPDGKLPSPEWSFVAWTAVIASVLVALGEAFGRDNAGTDFGSIANPVAVGGAVGNALDMLGGFGNVLLILSLLASVAAPFVRLSRVRGAGSWASPVLWACRVNAVGALRRGRQSASVPWRFSAAGCTSSSLLPSRAVFSLVEARRAIKT